MTFPVTTTGGGVMTATGPDVCNTPSPAGPVPIPYPLTAQAPQATGTSMKVKVVNMMPLVQGSKIPMSMGDQAGNSPGGVVSGVFGQQCQPAVLSMKVKFENKGVCRMTSLWQMNGASANIVGQQAAPSQPKVICM